MAAATHLEPTDPRWPRRLRELTDPPRALWVRGTLPTGRAVAVVGARGADAVGCRRAREIASTLARADVVVVSGGARGIDGAAHEGAVESGGRTVVVLASGVDVDYPREHAALFAAIEQAHGAVISEAPPGSPAFRGAFLRRNRLIAALADACVVVQADRRSGSLATARAAERLGRLLLASPWPSEHPLGCGIRQLLDRGAIAVHGGADVLRALGWPVPAPPDRTEDRLALRGLGARIFRLLADRDASVDEIATVTGAKPQDICRTLLTLELQRLVIRSLSGRYGRNR